ncbi:MAG TPA: flagellar assembly protein FliW [Pantanalinema sp.]
MTITTRQFGPIDYSEEAVITFPEGLLGFERMHRFLLIDQPEIEPLRWLQSIDEPQIAFTVIEPELVFPTFRVRLSATDREGLGLGPGSEPRVLVLVTVPQDPADMTANLLGPLVVHPDKKLGRQLVLHDSALGTRERLIPGAASAVTA